MICPTPVSAAEKVRLQLKWQHQFQFAGYYAAQARGYYKAAGLDVEIIPSQPGEDAMQEVLQGKADFGVGTTDLLLLREQGEPVVALAVIFQHSPLSFLTLKQNRLQSIHDLAGGKIMIEPGSAELYAYLRKEGIPTEKLTLLTHGFHAKDLQTGGVDAISTYVTDEPFELRSIGQEYMIYSPRSVGIDFYGDTLFSTEGLIAQNPKMVEAFLDASLKGWAYAMQNTEELVQLIYLKYSQRHTIEHLRFEASQMAPLLQASLVEVGHMNPGRWQHIAETYAEQGMLQKGFDLEGFLYDSNPPLESPKWLYWIIGVGALLITFVSVMSGYIHRINRRLRQDVVKRLESERQVRQLVRQLEIEKEYAEKRAITDSLTKLANRRYFDEALSSEFYRSKRSGAPLSLIMIDLDHFKEFNDNLGHLAGDDCLRQIAGVINKIVTRAPDIAARFGGEEFAVILPETEKDGASSVAEEIRKTVEKLAFAHPESTTAKHVTVSLGVVTVFTIGLSEPDKIVSLADDALYSAKKKGRNRTEISLYDIENVRNLSHKYSSFVRLVWKPNNEFGNEIIDNQHKKLFEISNELLSAILDNWPKDECTFLIDTFLTEIENHFRDEEAIILTADYPFYEEHIKCHSDLLAKANTLSKKYQHGELTLGELSSFLADDVVVQHMFVEDKKFIPYIIKMDKHI